MLLSEYVQKPAVSELQRDSRIPSLIDDLASQNGVVRTKARLTLVCLGSSAVPALIQTLAHLRPHVRWEAAKALCEIADPIAATALVNALDDSDVNVRWVAAEGVIALGRDGLQPFLEALLQRSQSTWFCECAQHICHAIAKQKQFGPLLQPLLTAFNRFEPQVFIPLAAYNAIAKLRAMA